MQRTRLFTYRAMKERQNDLWSENFYSLYSLVSTTRILISSIFEIHYQFVHHTSARTVQVLPS